MRSDSTTQADKHLEKLTVLQAINRRIAEGGSTEVIIRGALDLLLERLGYQAAQIYQLT